MRVAAAGGTAVLFERAQAATNQSNAIPGIDGICGGNCSCGTCLVYVDEACLGAVGEPDTM